jgi:Fe-S oxidoreductase
MEYAEILHRCFRCGYCKLPGDYTDINCPSYLKFRFETFSPGGRMWLLRAMLNKKIEMTSRLAEIMFSCTSCKNCVEHCAFPEFKGDLLNIFIAGKSELINKSAVPPKVRDYFESIYLHGNPYKLLRKNRGNWVKDLDIEPFSGQTYLFYVGCVGSYEDNGQTMAYNTARLLKNLGVSFGILGEKESCDGNEVRTMGEADLFQHMAEKNIQEFNNAGVKNIIALSPHAYHTFKNDYPKFGGKFNVYHYGQILRDFQKKMEIVKPAAPLKVTFHDPCYLGRHNNEYQAARDILRSIPDIELVEMKRAFNNGLCCGGGGGNFYTNILGGGPDSPARVRVREALETGADALVISCPQCMIMFEDAIKSENAGDKFRVMDLAEVMQLSIP